MNKKLSTVIIFILLFFSLNELIKLYSININYINKFSVGGGVKDHHIDPDGYFESLQGMGYHAMQDKARLWGVQPVTSGSKWDEDAKQDMMMRIREKVIENNDKLQQPTKQPSAKICNSGSYIQKNKCIPCIEQKNCKNHYEDKECIIK